VTALRRRRSKRDSIQRFISKPDPTIGESRATDRRVARGATPRSPSLFIKIFLKVEYLACAREIASPRSRYGDFYNAGLAGSPKFEMLPKFRSFRRAKILARLILITTSRLAQAESTKKNIYIYIYVCVCVYL